MVDRQILVWGRCSSRSRESLESWSALLIRSPQHDLVMGGSPMLAHGITPVNTKMLREWNNFLDDREQVSKVWIENQISYSTILWQSLVQGKALTLFYSMKAERITKLWRKTSLKLAEVDSQDSRKKLSPHHKSTRWNSKCCCRSFSKLSRRSS